MIGLRSKTLGVIANVFLMLLGIGYIQYCRDGVLEFRHFIHGYSYDVLAQIVILLAGAFIVWLVEANRWTLRIILSVGLLANLVGVFHPAFLSSDLYRYVWDGRVQGAGINPYRYIPSDNHLKSLRDEQIYPNINRKDYAHTIYPPVAQGIFWAVTRVSDSESCMKAAMVAFEALGCWALLAILDFFGRPREEIIWYAWNPLCVWEIGSSGHVDAIAIAWISLAALLLLRRHTTASAVLLTLAGLTKLYPGTLLFCLGRRISRRAITVCAVVTLCAYGCYASVGRGVMGFLVPYTQEEGLMTGERYFFLELAHRYLRLPSSTTIYWLIVATVMAVPFTLAFRKDRALKQVLQYELAFTMILTLAFSPHYPWYFLWILPLAIAVGYLPAIVLTLDATYWFTTNLALPGPQMFRMNEYLYGIFFAAVLGDILWRRFRKTGQTESSDLLPERISERTIAGGRYVES